MNKTAKTDFPVHTLIAERWSPVGFSDRPVEAEKLGSLFEAARWAASCFNEQPWSFVMATKGSPEDYERILSCLVEKNQEWARSAPVLMITVAKLQFDRNGRDNRHAYHDVGLAMGNLCAQATAMGLFVHQMGGFDLDRSREVLGIPEGHDPVAAVAIGYLGDFDSLPESLRKREAAERTRKPLQGCVFEGTWGGAPRFLKSAAKD